tara:strand:- start:1282 stop:2157 length:876 start_codon:yes stop_codon:yes gene_type:complete
MAIRYWEGDESANISTANNWDGNTLPADDDTIIFSDDSVTFKDLTGDLSAKQNLHMIVGTRWTGTFGTSVAAAVFQLDSLEYSGQAQEAFIDLKAQDVGSSTTSVTVADTGSGDNALSLGGTAPLGTLRVLGGKGRISNRQVSRTITTVEVFGVSNSTIDISTVASSGETLRMDSGTVTIGGNYTNITVSGGVLIIEGTATSIATLDLFEGRVNYNVSGIASAITSSLSIYDGEFDASDTTASVATISGAELYESGKINEQNGLESIVWSGGIAYYGGNLLLDAGRVVTLS